MALEEECPNLSTFSTPGEVEKTFCGTSVSTGSFSKPYVVNFCSSLLRNGSSVSR